MSVLTARPDDVPENTGNVWDSTYANTPGPSTSDGNVTGVNLAASVALHIGRATEELQRTADRVGQMARALERNTPVDAARVASGTFVTGTPLVLDFGRPDKGTLWEVSSYAVGGTEVNVTASAGHLGLYVSGLPTLAGAGLGNCVGFYANPTASLTLPYVDYLSPGQVTVTDAENVFAIIFGGTNAQTYVGNIQFRVFNVMASQGVSSFTM